MTSEMLPALRSQSTVEAVLIDILDREWERQCERGAPLAITAPVRDALELVFASTPGGIFALAPDIREPAESPRAVVERLRDRLPSEIPSWSMRALGRVERLRPVRELAAASEAARRPALPPAASAPEPVQPALPPPQEPMPPLPQEPTLRAPVQRPAVTAKRAGSRRAVVTAAVGGSIVGLSCGLLSATLGLSVVVAGSAIGALAAMLGVGGASRVRRGGHHE